MRGALAICCAIALVACSRAVPPAAPADPPPAAGPVGATAAPALPPPEALADVVYRLADPAVPGAEKVALLAAGTASDAPVLDSFAAALRDGGFSPLTVTAADVNWSPDAPGDVRAVVTLTGPQAGPDGEFRFPLDFHPDRGGWQLSRETADLLLTTTP